MQGMLKISNLLQTSAAIRNAAQKWRVEATVQAPTLQRALHIVQQSGVLDPASLLRPSPQFAGVHLRVIPVAQYLQQFRTLYDKAVSLGVLRGRNEYPASRTRKAIVRDLWNALGYGDSRGLHGRHPWWNGELRHGQTIDQGTPHPPSPPRSPVPTPQQPSQPVPQQPCIAEIPFQGTSVRTLWSWWKENLVCPQCRACGRFHLCGTRGVFRARCMACPLDNPTRNRHYFNEKTFRVGCHVLTSCLQLFSHF